MQFVIEINVMPLRELLDPQGKAVEHSLHNMGFTVDYVRIGKHITMKLEAANREEAQHLADEACKKMLHNPVMEYYEFTVHE